MFRCRLAVRRGSVVPYGVAVVAAIVALPLAGQEAGTLPPLDPVYQDLAFLEAHGLVPRGLSSLRPLSYGRVGWLIRDARAWLTARPPVSSAAHDDLAAALARLERRFAPDALRRPELTAEVELGGGRSPGRGIPDNGIGGIDVVLNPLWADRGGRAYGDEGTAAASARATIRLGPHVAVGVAGRTSSLRASGLEPGRRGATVEAAYVRATLGRVVVQLGRDASWHGPGTPSSSLVLSDNAPPVDLVRIGTDRPLRAAFLGDLELAATASDLGPNHNFPHAKLFVFALRSRPVERLQLGLTLVNKQGGEGSPDASTADRLKDLSFIWDLFSVGTVYAFSDKMTSVELRLTLPSSQRVEMFGEFSLTDFDHRRVRTIMSTAAGYRFGMALPRMGDSGRHGLLVEGQWLGALMYRHGQFRSGMTADGFAQGSNLGPDGRRLLFGYRYYAPSIRWGGAVRATYEARRIDTHVRRRTPHAIFHRAEELPTERRYRLQLRATRWLGDRFGLDVSGGMERASDFAHESGAGRTNFAVLLHLWRSF